MKIRQKRYASGVVKWEADLGEINGRRVQRYFPTREQAKEFVREAQASLKLHGTDATFVSLADRLLFTKWKEELSKVGANIEQAGIFFLKHHVPLKQGPSLVELGKTYICAMQAGGESSLNAEKTIYSLKLPNLRNLFRYAETKGVHDIRDLSREFIEAWISEAGGKAETKKNRIRTVRHFLEWARRSNYIPFNPIMGRDNAIAVGEEKKGDILSYGVKEVRSLLYQVLNGQHRSKYNSYTDSYEWVSYRPFMGYIAAALFCGMRPEEIKRTPLSNLDLVSRRIVVTGKASKTNKPRVIELSRVATAWFRLWRRFCPEQTTLMPETFPGRWRGLRAVSGLPRLHDGLRHTFASMHYAEHQNAAQLQAVMGHDETQDTLFAHYRAVKTTGGEWMTKKMADEFWNLMPTAVRDYKEQK